VKPKRDSLKLLEKALKEDNLFSIKALIFMEHPDQVAQTRLFYAQSLLFVQFLMDGGRFEDRERFQAFLKGLKEEKRDAVSTGELFVEVFRDDLAGLEQRWKAYLEQRLQEIWIY